MNPKQDYPKGGDSPRERLARKRAEQAYSPERLLQEEELDEGLLDSFPASDPISISQPTTAAPTVSNQRLSVTGDAIRKHALSQRRPRPT